LPARATGLVSPDQPYVLRLRQREAKEREALLAGSMEGEGGGRKGAAALVKLIIYHHSRERKARGIL